MTRARFSVDNLGRRTELPRLARWSPDWPSIRERHRQRARAARVLRLLAAQV